MVYSKLKDASQIRVLQHVKGARRWFIYWKYS